MFKIKLENEPSLWYSGAALACFVVAVVAGAVGSVLTSASLLNAQQHPTVYAIGLISLIISLPILILGGHCLDLNDRKRKNQTRLSTPSKPHSYL